MQKVLITKTKSRQQIVSLLNKIIWISGKYTL